MTNLVPRLRTAPLTAPSRSDADGEVAEWETNDGRTMVGFIAAGEGWILVEGSAAFAFGDSGDVLVAPEGGLPPDALDEIWQRSVLPLVVQARGTQVLHASAVRRPGGAIVALCGKATAGKSTLAAALMRRAGVEVVADDALPVSIEDTGVRAHPLPFRLRLRPAAAQALELPVVSFEGDEAKPSPLGGIVLLDPRDSGRPAAVLVRPAEALGALMSHAYCFSLRSAKTDLVRDYSSLCELVPVRRLAFARRLDRLGDALEALGPLLASA